MDADHEYKELMKYSRERKISSCSKSNSVTCFYEEIYWDLRLLESSIWNTTAAMNNV